MPSGGFILFTELETTFLCLSIPTGLKQGVDYMASEILPHRITEQLFFFFEEKMGEKTGNLCLSPYRLDNHELSNAEIWCISQALIPFSQRLELDALPALPAEAMPFFVPCSKSVLSEFLIIITSQNRSSLFSSHSRLTKIVSD